MSTTWAATSMRSVKSMASRHGALSWTQTGSFQTRIISAAYDKSGNGPTGQRTASSGAQCRRHGYSRRAQRREQPAEQTHRQRPHHAGQREGLGNLELKTVAEGTHRQSIEERPRQAGPEERARQRQQHRLAEYGSDDGAGAETDGAQRRQLPAARVDDRIQRVHRPQRRPDSHDRAEEVADEVEQRIQLLARVLNHLPLVAGLEVQRRVGVARRAKR